MGEGTDTRETNKSMMMTYTELKEQGTMMYLLIEKLRLTKRNNFNQTGGEKR